MREKKELQEQIARTGRLALPVWTHPTLPRSLFPLPPPLPSSPLYPLLLFLLFLNPLFLLIIITPPSPSSCSFQYPTPFFSSLLLHARKVQPLYKAYQYPPPNSYIYIYTHTIYVYIYNKISTRSALSSLYTIYNI